jgi:hypothetical protein
MVATATKPKQREEWTEQVGRNLALSVVSLPLVFIDALIVMLAWGDLMHVFHQPYFLGYWAAVALCFAWYAVTSPFRHSRVSAKPSVVNVTNNSKFDEEWEKLSMAKSQ